MTAEQHKWVFISYDTETGLNLARLAKMRLQLAGHKGWVWQDDSPIGGYNAEEIANNIEKFGHFLYICTRRSDASKFQTRERSYALEYFRSPIIIAFDGRHVSGSLSIYKQIRTTNVGFQQACDDAASEIARRRKVRVPDAADEPATSGIRRAKKIVKPEGDSVESA